MTYEILKHTADLRMKVAGDTPEHLFAEAMRGMMSVLKADIPAGAPVRKREISLEARDLTALLVDFLNEVLSLAQINKEVFPNVAFGNLTETSLEAEIEGVGIEKFDEDIKAVTYHEAEVRKNAEGKWETMLVFDI